MAVKFTIKNGCVGCGMCYAQYANYFQENDDGSAAVNAGKILENKTEAEKIASVCPNRVISIESAGENKKQAAMQAIQKLKNFQGCPIPSKGDFSFDIEEYTIDTPWYTAGSNKYEYNNSRSANNAALEEFNSQMYCHVDQYIMKIITEYKVKHLKPYYTKNIDEGSIYAKTNKKVSELLREVKSIVEGNLSSDYDQVSVFPQEDIVWKNLNRGEMMSSELVSMCKNDLEDINYYSMYWTTECAEGWTGKNWLGKTIIRDMYCYTSLYEAYKMLANDIRLACAYNRHEIESRARVVIEPFVSDYNKKLKEILKNKIQIAERAINNM